MSVLKIKPTPKGEGGTTVVANPELVGTEPNLTGLEVAGTKYKVPEGGSGGGLGLKYQDTRDVVDFVYTDIHSKLYGEIATTIDLDASKLKQILVKAGVDLNQPFHDAGEGTQGMDTIEFIFNLSYTHYVDPEIARDAVYHLFRDFKLRMWVYFSYGELYELQIQDTNRETLFSISLTDATGVTTWEDLFDWMIETNTNLPIGDGNKYWGSDIYEIFNQEYNWAIYPTFSTVYIDNGGEDAYRADLSYVDIQDLKDALIYHYVGE